MFYPTSRPCIHHASTRFHTRCLHIAVCCRVLQCVAGRCSVLQCTTCIHNAPIHIHHAPTHIHNAPIHIHNAPIHIHNAPIHIHDAPVHMHYAHTHMYTRWAYEPLLDASAKHIMWYMGTIQRWAGYQKHNVSFATSPTRIGFFCHFEQTDRQTDRQTDT